MSRTSSATRPSRLASRTGFTLVELLVVIGIIALLISILLPSLNRAREQANRIKCASNLRQIAMAAIIYAGENKGRFPRTYWDSESYGKNDDRTGGRGTGQTADSFSISSPKTPVGGNNVTASFYLLAKTTDLTLDSYVCPSTNATKAYEGDDPQNYANFPNDVGVQTHLSYAYTSPFTHRNRTFKWDTTLSPDFAFAADMGPSRNRPMANGDSRGTDSPGVEYNMGKRDIARGNSNNHGNEGQQVVYVDAHVEWHSTPFAGPQKPGKPYRDKITNNSDGENANGGNSNWGAPMDQYDIHMVPNIGD